MGSYRFSYLTRWISALG